MDAGTLQLIIGGTLLLLVGTIVVRWILWVSKEPRPRQPWGGSRTSATSMMFWDASGGDFSSGVNGGDGDVGGGCDGGGGCD